ncbi:MAG: acetate--CoA ligase family protein [Armatimonadota bacterium]|nr:acetate--CoA ligase family protein [Armatimonadota bacterium]
MATLQGRLPFALARGLLGLYGIEFCRDAIVETPEEAAAAAERLGFPVVIKADRSHKSDADGVRLGLREGAAVREAAAELLTRLRSPIRSGGRRSRAADSRRRGQHRPGRRHRGRVPEVEVEGPARPPGAARRAGSGRGLGAGPGRPVHSARSPATGPLHHPAQGCYAPVTRGLPPGGRRPGARGRQAGPTRLDAPG